MDDSEVKKLIEEALEELYKNKWLTSHPMITKEAIARQIYFSLLKISAKGLRDFIFKEL